MKVVPKNDGSCSQTVGFPPFDGATYHHTHITESIFVQASRIPESLWKSRADAENGFHSVPLQEESRELIMFLTTWGRYLYLVNPQG